MKIERLDDRVPLWEKILRHAVGIPQIYTSEEHTVCLELVFQAINRSNVAGAGTIAVAAQRVATSFARYGSVCQSYDKDAMQWRITLNFALSLYNDITSCLRIARAPSF